MKKLILSLTITLVISVLAINVSAQAMPVEKKAKAKTEISDKQKLTSTKIAPTKKMQITNVQAIIVKSRVQGQSQQRRMLQRQKN